MGLTVSSCERGKSDHTHPFGRAVPSWHGETWVVLVIKFLRDDHTDAFAAVTIVELTRATGEDGRSALPWHWNDNYPYLWSYLVSSAHASLYQPLEHMTRLVHLQSTPHTDVIRGSFRQGMKLFSRTIIDEKEPPTLKFK